MAGRLDVIEFSRDRLLHCTADGDEAHRRMKALLQPLSKGHNLDKSCLLGNRSPQSEALRQERGSKGEGHPPPPVSLCTRALQAENLSI